MTLNANLRPRKRNVPRNKRGSTRVTVQVLAIVTAILGFAQTRCAGARVDSATAQLALLAAQGAVALGKSEVQRMEEASRLQRPMAPDPAKARSCVVEGNTLYANNDFDQAALAYQWAVAADPENIEAQFRLGMAFASLGNLSLAIGQWELVLRASSDPAMRTAAQDNLSRAHERLQSRRE